MRLSARQFDVATRGSRLGESALTAGRAVLVDGRAPIDVARELGLTRQRVHAIARRVFDLHQAAGVVKVTAAEFMASRPRREDVLAPFVRELRRLACSGRGIEEMKAYLLANDVKSTSAEIEQVLASRKGRDENGGVSEPKGRRRQIR
jgi:hypothetical protein